MQYSFVLVALLTCALHQQHSQTNLLQRVGIFVRLVLDALLCMDTFQFETSQYTNYHWNPPPLNDKSTSIPPKQPTQAAEENVNSYIKSNSEPSLDTYVGFEKDSTAPKETTNTREKRKSNTKTFTPTIYSLPETLPLSERLSLSEADLASLRVVFYDGGDEKVSTGPLPIYGVTVIIIGTARNS